MSANHHRKQTPDTKGFVQWLPFKLTYYRFLDFFEKAHKIADNTVGMTPASLLSEASSLRAGLGAVGLPYEHG